MTDGDCVPDNVRAELCVVERLLDTTSDDVADRVQVRVDRVPVHDNVKDQVRVATQVGESLVLAVWVSVIVCVRRAVTLLLALHEQDSGLTVPVSDCEADSDIDELKVALAVPNRDHVPVEVCVVEAVSLSDTVWLGDITAEPDRERVSVTECLPDTVEVKVHDGETLCDNVSDKVRD